MTIPGHDLLVSIHIGVHLHWAMPDAWINGEHPER
jgi:hypothetical protein